MSQLLDSLDIGDTIDIKGPVGEIVYLEPGQFLIKGKPRNASKLAMLAGGTGITPMYQVIKAVLNNPSDKTECSLVYANQTLEDILLKDEVGGLANIGGFVWGGGLIRDNFSLLRRVEPCVERFFLF